MEAQLVIYSFEFCDINFDIISYDSWKKFNNCF